MNFPYISGAGIYRSELSEYKKSGLSPWRKVREYEIELFCDDFQFGMLNDQRIQYKKGTVLIAKPGNLRCSKFHFSCYYLHATVTDSSLKEALEALPGALQISDEETYIGLFQRIAALFPEHSNQAPLEVTGLLMLLIANLQKDSGLNVSPDGAALPQMRKDAIYTARTLINENYREDLNLRTLAESVHLNPNYFHKLFTTVCGQTPLEYLTGVRISHAKYELLNTDRSIMEISELCGFSSYNYFCTVFRKKCGMSPLEFRKKANNYYSAGTTP